MSPELREPQNGFRFRLVHPDGTQETMIVDAERALIGSATHCEVRLSPDVAAHEHVEVLVHEGTVHFATRPYARANLPVLDGTPTVEGRWRTGSALRIANVQLYVETVSLGMPKAKPPIWALFVAVPTIVLTLVGIAFARTPDRGLPPIPDAPAILAPKDAKCPELAPEQRSVLAAEKLRVALAKRERSPFAPQDAFEAIALFELAAACHRGAAEEEQAKSAEEAAAVLRTKVDEDYRLRRVRLEHAYRTHQLHAMKHELAVLVPMTAHRRGPYTEWLAAVDRAATMEISERGSLTQ